MGTRNLLCFDQQLLFITSGLADASCLLSLLNMLVLVLLPWLYPPSFSSW